jgi:hypothetical protein
MDNWVAVLRVWKVSRDLRNDAGVESLLLIRCQVAVVIDHYLETVWSDFH